MYDSSYSLSFFSGTEQFRRHVGIGIVGEDFFSTIHSIIAMYCWSVAMQSVLQQGVCKNSKRILLGKKKEKKKESKRESSRTISTMNFDS